MQAEYKKIIKVSPESCAKLAALHNCSHSSLAGRIRMDALNVFGGIEAEKVVFY